MIRILAALVVCSCGTTPTYVGQWRHVATECGGRDVVVPGWTATYDLGEASGSAVDGVPGSRVKLGDIPITGSGSKIEIAEGSAGAVACEPDPCTMDLGIGKYECPAQFPISGIVLTVESVGAGTLTASANGCTVRMVRQ